MATPGEGGIFIFLSSKVNEEVAKLQDLYNCQNVSPKPHITIAYPPFISLEDWLKVRSTVVSCAKKVKPFKITLNDTGIFEIPQFLWLKPDNFEKLSEIRDHLFKEFPAGITGLNEKPYCPHVSVGYLESKESLFRAEKDLAKRIRPERMSFMVYELYYTVLGKDWKWHIHDMISLG